MLDRHPHGVRTIWNDQRIVCQLRQCDGRGFFAARRARRNEKELFFDHGDGLKGRLICRVVDQRAVDSAAAKPLQNISGQSFRGRQARIRQIFAESHYQGHGHVAAKAWRQTEGQMTRVAVASIVQLLLRLPKLHQDSARMFEQLRSRLSEGDAASVAIQQTLTAFEFQLANLPAQGWLYHRQKGGGTGKTAKFRDMPKVFELLEIHNHSLCYRDMR